jgi:hypothetical protein
MFFMNFTKDFMGAYSVLMRRGGRCGVKRTLLAGEDVAGCSGRVARGDAVSGHILTNMRTARVRENAGDQEAVRGQSMRSAAPAWWYNQNIMNISHRKAEN